MTRPIVLLDMDGPLADFDGHFWRRCLDRGITFDIESPDDQRHRYFTEHIPNRRERRWARDMVDQAGWFADLPVTRGAQDAVAELVERFDVWVCTKPLTVNPTCLNDKHAWLVDHFPVLADRMITAPDKSMIHGTVLIDDAPKPEWFARASWRPVIFGAPFNGPSQMLEYLGLTRISWDYPEAIGVLTELIDVWGRAGR